ncbi:hypothetical protein NDU88_003255 [Pleurodeles waltl]|uniref:Uncharacterized protein n=1 Tax=Pleurodeles waltl TaxID=8319 RepID=A0AAV7QBM1_PLEWA|nr:hypothetical protein NDU88_003255 [Pleurodeles waltl]
MRLGVKNRVEVVQESIVLELKVEEGDERLTGNQEEATMSRVKLEGSKQDNDSTTGDPTEFICKVEIISEERWEKAVKGEKVLQKVMDLICTSLEHGSYMYRLEP